MRMKVIFDNCIKKIRKTEIFWMRCTPYTTRLFQSRFSKQGGGLACCYLYTNIQAIAPPMKSPSKTNALISPIGAIIARNAISVPTPSIKNLPDHVSKIGTCSVAISFVVRKVAVLSIVNDEINENAIKPIIPVNSILTATFNPAPHLPSPPIGSLKDVVSLKNYFQKLIAGNLLFYPRSSVSPFCFTFSRGEQNPSNALIISPQPRSNKKMTNIISNGFCL